MEKLFYQIIYTIISNSNSKAFRWYRNLGQGRLQGGGPKGDGSP